MSSASAIIDELKAAFPAIRERRFEPLVNSLQGDEPAQVEADFSDKDDWTKLSPSWLDRVPDGLGSALSFLSNEAIRFYIPAFMAADLAGALHRVDPAFHLVHGFDDKSRRRKIRADKRETWGDVACACWDRLAQDQVCAIVHYLEWRVERDGTDIEHRVVEALAAYWYPRAAGHWPDFSDSCVIH
ncbi:DUF6714 family protein [Parvularcula sp. LCG005]|uniref:DUF6714 family protein n=1 Tax=Parvularcula sp. LCG005 TaxID=3078805 RepID=UPI0029424BAF|nr:DUF6714 family protein [Parvularcula sp. LCG005]WOI52024.1 DUF6714 family protein [Parvularcula sp. LCG005]